MKQNKNNPKTKQYQENNKNIKEKVNESFERHFRIYLVSGHPAFIIDEEGEYYFHRVTSSPKSGHHKNWEINPNPDPKRSTPMYIVKMEQKDKKKRFGKKLTYKVDLIFIERKK